MLPLFGFSVRVKLVPELLVGWLFSFILGDVGSISGFFVGASSFWDGWNLDREGFAGVEMELLDDYELGSLYF